MDVYVQLGEEDSRPNSISMRKVTQVTLYESEQLTISFNNGHSVIQLKLKDITGFNIIDR